MGACTAHALVIRLLQLLSPRRSPPGEPRGRPAGCVIIGLFRLVWPSDVFIFLLSLLIDTFVTFPLLSFPILCLYPAKNNTLASFSSKDCGTFLCNQPLRSASRESCGMQQLAVPIPRVALPRRPHLHDGLTWCAGSSRCRKCAEEEVVRTRTPPPLKKERAGGVLPVRAGRPDLIGSRSALPASGPDHHLMANPARSTRSPSAARHRRGRRPPSLALTATAARVLGNASAAVSRSRRWVPVRKSARPMAFLNCWWAQLSSSRASRHRSESAAAPSVTITLAATPASARTLITSLAPVRHRRGHLQVINAAWPEPPYLGRGLMGHQCSPTPRSPRSTPGTA